MRFHSQNLNDEKFGRRGSMVRHGRCWLEISPGPRGTGLRIEWSLLRRGGLLGVGFDFADYEEDAVGGHVGLGPLGAIYWGVQHHPLRRLFERWTSRDKEPRTYESQGA